MISLQYTASGKHLNHNKKASWWELSKLPKKVCPRHRLPLFRQFLTSFEFGILNPKFYIKKKHYMVTSHVAVLGFLSQGGRHAQGRSTKLSSPSKATEWMLSFIRNDHCVTDVKEWLCTMHCKPKKCTYIPFPDETRETKTSAQTTKIQILPPLSFSFLIWAKKDFRFLFPSLLPTCPRRFLSNVLFCSNYRTLTTTSQHIKFGLWMLAVKP